MHISLEVPLILCVMSSVWQNPHSLGSCTEILPIDIDCIHFICQFHQFCGIKARECFHRGPLKPKQDMLGDLIVSWAAFFWWQWTLAEGTDGSILVSAQVPDKLVLALGTIFRYSEQILICMIYDVSLRFSVFMICGHRTACHACYELLETWILN